MAEHARAVASAVRAEATTSVPDTGRPAPATPRPDDREWHDDEHWPPAPMPAAGLQVRRAVAQYDSWRGGRLDPERRAAGGGGLPAELPAGRCGANAGINRPF